MRLNMRHFYFASRASTADADKIWTKGINNDNMHVEKKARAQTNLRATPQHRTGSVKLTSSFLCKTIGDYFVLNLTS